MNTDKWERAKQVFQSALELSDDARHDFVVRSCANDKALQNEVESLIDSFHQAGSFIQRPIVEDAIKALDETAAGAQIGQRIGPYEIVKRLGRGGMGDVFLANRIDEQFEKKVAIKLVKRGLDRDFIHQRFISERQILANLEHPNIARLIDGGRTADGSPYLVMEYVAGIPIDLYCDRLRLTVTERLQLFRTVCAAVHYAHQHLVIHRDIKPSNILVTNQGIAKLLDFGIAKILIADNDAGMDRTATAMRLMTTDYASPEQIRGQSITTSTDVYALGILLYRLLTGHHPYRLDTPSAREVERIVCDQNPSKPSAAVSRIEEATASDGVTTLTLTPNSVSEARDSQPEKLRRRLSGDLDNIVLMALRKEPQRRYGSVEQFSEDIRRHLEGLPVIARQDTLAYRSAKFLSRHRIGVVAGALVVLTLFAGLLGIAWEAHAARKERDSARLEKAKAERINTFLQDMVGLTNPGWFSPSVQRDHDVTVKELLDEMAARVETEMADQPDVRSAMQRSIGNSYLYQLRFDVAEHHLRAALDTELKLYGELSPETARTLTFLGNSRMLQSDVPGAETLYQKAVNIFRNTYRSGGEDPAWYVAACSGYGQALWRKGDREDAAAVFNEGLKLSPQISGSDRAVIAIMLSNLAYVKADEGKLAEAESLHREALKEFHNLPGRTRWEMGSSLTGLGEVLNTEGRYAEAEDALRQGLDAYRTVWGDNSLYIGYNLNVQGLVLYRLADYVAAEQQAQKSLDIYRGIYHEANPIYASPMITIGLAMNRTGRSTEAESFLRPALELRQKFLPGGSYLVALAQASLGECLISQKRFSEAESLLIPSYESLKATLGEKHARTIETRQRLFNLYHAWGKFDEAARYQ